MAGELEGRVIVVTGAEGDIGRATVGRLAAEGAQLVLTDLRAEVAEVADEVVKQGGSAVAVQADVTRAEDCARIAAAAREAFGGVDALINNHGAIVGAPFLETTEEQWDFVHGVVLKSIFLVSREIVPLMADRDGANVVNIASTGVQGRVHQHLDSSIGSGWSGSSFATPGAADGLYAFGVTLSAGGGGPQHRGKPCTARPRRLAGYRAGG